jgi:hypothetical protein
MRAILVAFLALVASDAAACIRNPAARTYQEKLEVELNYLFCLHNEQSEAINDLARQLDKANTVAFQEDTVVQMLQMQVDALKTKVSALEMRQRIADAPPPPIKRTPEEEAELQRSLDGIAKIMKQNMVPQSKP